MDGRGFDPTRVDVSARLGTSELWQWHNSSNRVHPMHLHGMLFRIVERSTGVVHAGRARLEGHRSACAGETVTIQPWFMPVQGTLRVPLPQAGARRQGDDAAAGGGQVRRRIPVLARRCARARRRGRRLRPPRGHGGRDRLARPLGPADLADPARRQGGLELRRHDAAAQPVAASANWVRNVPLTSPAPPGDARSRPRRVHVRLPAPRELDDRQDHRRQLRRRRPRRR